MDQYRGNKERLIKSLCHSRSDFSKDEFNVSLGYNTFMNRKDDHVRLALQQPFQTNDFDRVRLKHDSLSPTSLATIELSTQFLNQTIPYPFYINAMTGGSESTKDINRRLAQLAAHFKIPMATGSMSAALKDSSLTSSFTIARDVNPQGFLIANLGGGQPLQNALKAIHMIQANALQIHLNVIQEIIMPEGDKDFSNWSMHLEAIAKNIPVPLLVKEVGFGMTKKTFLKLKRLGIRYVDVAGQGGTNFALIENERRDQPLSLFNTMGLSTVESLLEAKQVDGLSIYASGGVRHGLDIVKALVLGAQAVGLSGYFLKLVSLHDHDTSIQKVNQLIEEIKTTMAIVGAQSIEQLKSVEYVLDSVLLDYLKQRS
jgi:isopentenyl-diphosphate delta-isomerase